MSLPLERWTVSLDSQGRMKRIDAELKEKLSPFGAARSERFKFAYELAFAIICGDRTSETIQAVLAEFQLRSDMKSSYRVPRSADKKGPEKEQGTGDSGPLVIKGFQGGTRWDFESLLQRCAGVH